MKNIGIALFLVLAGRGAGYPNPPRLEPIVPNSGNSLKTKLFTVLHGEANTAHDRPSPLVADKP